MSTLIPGTRAPLKVWADPDTIEPAALQQLRNTANLPWAYGVSVMPDVHYGKGATVGSVIAMKDAVSPAAVGVDIGCGMSAVVTDLTANDLPDDLGSIRADIEAAVPVGFNSHEEWVDGWEIRDPYLGTRLAPELEAGAADFWHRFDYLHPGVQDRLQKAGKQIGTLGGGNHFIELCADENQRVWLMLHSGSRNIGKELAERHIAIAQKLPQNLGLPDRDLSVFLAETPQMDAYRRDLFWAQEYARRNRATMLALAQAAVAKSFNRSVNWGKAISCHHNYVSEETYDGVDLLVTRKGAISTADNRLGIIPGSMGTGSYIVRGKANRESFMSASHGAGRTMSRNAARKTFSIADLQAQTDGVECRKDAGVLDEIPAAYKNLEDVMSKQKDLVDVVHRLRTLVCVKG